MVVLSDWQALQFGCGVVVHIPGIIVYCKLIYRKLYDTITILSEEMEITPSPTSVSSQKEVYEVITVSADKQPGLDFSCQQSLPDLKTFQL